MAAAWVLRYGSWWRHRRTDVAPFAWLVRRLYRRRVEGEMVADAPATVLVVEDDPGIAELERGRLEDAGYRVVVAGDAAAAADRLRDGPVDLVLLDYRLPGGVDGLEFYARLRAAGFDPPVILVTGFSDEGTVIRALRAGVRDFVTKSIEYLDYLPEAVLRVLGQVGTERRLVESETRFRRSEVLFRRVWEKAHDGMRLTAADGTIRRVNDAYCRTVGLPREALEGKPLTAAYSADQGVVLLAEHAARFAARSDAPPFTKDRVLWDGRRVQLDASYAFLDPPGQPPLLLSVVRDVTAQARLEEQLRRVAKMEVVGRLAGGVAHDFNNLLTVINGFGDLALDVLAADHPARPLVAEVRRSGDRAADLTRQLLALSRQQVVEPKVLDLNAVVGDAARMLGRLAGADVALRTALAPDLRRLRGDPGQVEQVVMNLVVNARDAMPGGGTLTVETRNAAAADAARAGAEPRPGGYVVLRVTDTGTGMTADVRDRIFEPFFTTKAAGKGTGLGLPTVYTIVQQAGGRVVVESEVGRGTTFEVYFPATTDAADAGRAASAVRDRRGSETVVLAEDDEGVRGFARRVLEGAGYAVLEAADGAAALARVEGYAGPIDALVTDVVMPGMGGRELAARVAALRRGVKVLYLSGYTPDAVLRHGVEEAAVAFLQKPFTPAALAAKVREVLDAPV